MHPMTELMHPMTEMFTADIRHYSAARGLDLVHFAEGQHKDEVARARQRYASVQIGIAWRLHRGGDDGW